MISTLKLMLALATVLGVVVTTVNSIPPKSQNLICDGNFKKDQLQNYAQQALDAINSTRTLTASQKLAGKGQHVFNNNLLKFHRSVLEKLLKDLRGYDKHMKNLEKDLVNPLSEDHKKKIGTEMVVDLSSKDEYVDYNAVVFGAYVEKLRHELVEYLKADTSDNDDERNRIKTQVQLITNNMVNLNVYVDPMACDHWLKKNPKKNQQFKDIRDALRNMFQNILQDFKTVSKNIKDLYKSGKWNR
ncbi:uncharacterized protein LOC125262495 isoform X1 [Megalobrama amblycephala]|uniref:uncharacterized protein LOC125262495 isoform X1 n=1 Tax=Megalobrama amblycephala TaxID=75352 RepID=UPI0020145949|nr:uncharacterized protein LOC125262495 isoform X1 [Megalobrama amblycephala]